MGTVAVLTAILTAAVTDAVTGVLTNGLRGGWERVTGGQALVLNVTVRPMPGEACGSQWLLPPGAGPVPDEDAFPPARLVAWARSRGGTPLPAPTVELTVRGRTGDVVVLRELRATVLERRPVPTGEMATVGCGGDLAVRTFGANLDDEPPVLQPLGGSTPGDVPPVRFPYRVTSSDAEVIRVRAFTGNCDCRWVLDLVYVDGGQERTLRVDDGGQPFRTVGSQPPPAPTGSPTTRPGAGP